MDAIVSFDTMDTVDAIGTIVSFDTFDYSTIDFRLYNIRLYNLRKNSKSTDKQISPEGILQRSPLRPLEQIKKSHQYKFF